MWHAGKFHTATGSSFCDETLSLLARLGVSARVVSFFVPGAGRAVPVAVVCSRGTTGVLDGLASLGDRGGLGIVVFGLDDACGPVVPGGWRPTRHGSAASFEAWHFDGSVVVVGAGTVDLPLVRDIAGIVAAFGCEVDVVHDVGVASPGRVVAASDLFSGACAVVVCAGMDGALPRAVADLCTSPVILCPSPVGYGVAESGLAAWVSGTLGSTVCGVASVLPGDAVGAAVMALRCARLKSGGGVCDSDL